MRNLLISALLLLTLAFAASAIPPAFLEIASVNPFGDEIYDSGVMPLEGTSVGEDFWWDPVRGVWISDATYAQSLNNGPGWGSNGVSNIAALSTAFKTTASLAQWVSFNLLTTQKDWLVRQPGVYASDWISFSIQSNNDVLLTFEGFGPLVHQMNFNSQDDSINPEIPVWYGFGSSPSALDLRGTWVPADDTNFYFGIEDSLGLHNGLSTRMYAKIQVVNCNSASQYETVGMIYLTLQNQKVWIDTTSGDFVWIEE